MGAIPPYDPEIIFFFRCWGPMLQHPKICRWCRGMLGGLGCCCTSHQPGANRGSPLPPSAEWRIVKADQANASQQVHPGWQMEGRRLPIEGCCRALHPMCVCFLTPAHTHALPSLARIRLFEVVVLFTGTDLLKQLCISKTSVSRLIEIVDYPLPII